MSDIYGLFSGRNGIVRYVGLTTYGYKVRFEQHKRDAGWSTAQLYKWFHAEWLEGYPIETALLQWCERDLRHQTETEWIRKFQNLFNERKQPPWGWISTRVSRPPKVPEVSAYMRRYIFNVDGFRGVHYDRQLDLYFVQIYTGRGVEWLLGNEVPGWGGNIWFSDSTAAVKARDRHRQGRIVNWLPDIRQTEF